MAHSPCTDSISYINSGLEDASSTCTISDSEPERILDMRATLPRLSKYLYETCPDPVCIEFFISSQFAKDIGVYAHSPASRYAVLIEKSRSGRSIAVVDAERCEIICPDLEAIVPPDDVAAVVALIKVRCTLEMGLPVMGICTISGEDKPCYEGYELHTIRFIFHGRLRSAMLC